MRHHIIGGGLAVLCLGSALAGAAVVWAPLHSAAVQKLSDQDLGKIRERDRRDFSALVMRSLCREAIEQWVRAGRPDAQLAAIKRRVGCRRP